MAVADHPAGLERIGRNLSYVGHRRFLLQGNLIKL
jgi:hypothetical protein